MVTQPWVKVTSPENKASVSLNNSQALDAEVPEVISNVLLVTFFMNKLMTRVLSSPESIWKLMELMIPPMPISSAV